MVAKLTPEDSHDVIEEEEKTSNGGVLIILTLCLSFLVGFGCLIAGISWIFAYLWNVGIAPLGLPTIVWWQWTIFWFFIITIKNIFKKES